MQLLGTKCVRCRLGRPDSSISTWQCPPSIRSGSRPARVGPRRGFVRLLAVIRRSDQKSTTTWWTTNFPPRWSVWYGGRPQIALPVAVLFGCVSSVAGPGRFFLWLLAYFSRGACLLHGDHTAACDNVARGILKLLDDDLFPQQSLSV